MDMIYIGKHKVTHFHSDTYEMKVLNPRENDIILRGIYRGILRVRRLVKINIGADKRSQ